MSADNVEGVDVRVQANDFDRATAAFERGRGAASEARGVGPAGLLDLVHDLVPGIDLTVGRNNAALER